MVAGEEMDDDFFSNTENVRANWMPPHDQYFVELLMDQVQRGNKTGYAFKQQAWVDMITEFNSKFGFKYDIDVLKNRFKRMRKQYNDMRILLAQSGFEWDEAMKMVKADDNTWDEYLKLSASHSQAHPDMQIYRTKAVQYYKELCMICGHTVADGRYSLSCFDVDFENEVDDKTPSAGDRSKIDWTPTMDQYFLELMLALVHKGNKVGRTFKKKAWVCMITLFNAKFGFQHSRAVLKNRYKILRSQYASIRTLLTQKGFHWDETQKMVLADDRVWNKYIKKIQKQINSML
ncbi:L10-interacting MYB domain-containing protein-like [Durio zibethinus]|uniref:L10-interacting MYB domain-containing protein-like n=1 Tax=Durio zibethinus TaxID=66656 RepID=A0A6P6AQ30_DURZI|nr:L10-interacting MYB domain-containing protein-like [Durio zibethinus]